MAGQGDPVAGVWRILSGAYRTPEVTLTEMTPRGPEADHAPDAQRNFNGVRGTFVSPANDRQPDDFRRSPRPSIWPRTAAGAAGAT